MQPKERYDRSDIRRLNAVSVLNQLRRNGALSRGNIASRLGLTRATVSNIVSDLIDRDLITETEYVEGAIGRPGLLLQLNANWGCMIAVEIDLDSISVVLANMGMEFIWREDHPLSADSSTEEALLLASSLVEQAVLRGSDKGLNCFGICVAWAGLVNRELGELAYGPISRWEHVPLKHDWEERFKVPVYLENEAHVAAIGAHHVGEAQGVDNLIYLSLGVGLAAGVFVDGVLIRGKQGYAGQVGHTRFLSNDITCACGKTGCWVTEVGASALRRKLEQAGVDLQPDNESGVDWMEQVLQRVTAGDSCTTKVLVGVGQQLGMGLARLVQSFNPSVIIVGGRMGSLMHFVKPAIHEALQKETLPNMAESLELIVSTSVENHLTGCLATVFDAVMKDPPFLQSSEKVS